MNSKITVFISKKMKNNADEQKKQDDYLKSNALNMVSLMGKRHCAQFSAFLDERQQDLILELLRHEHIRNYCFFGGHDDCERKMLGVFLDADIDLYDFPVKAVSFKIPKVAEVSHRDCLGALMGLQIKREMIGDIFIDNDMVTILLSESIFDFVCQNLDKVGKYNIKLFSSKPCDIKKKQELLELSGTVSSLRLDCVVAFLLNKSRTVSAQIIEKGFVKLNHIEAFSGSKQVSPGDVLAIRGSGKFIVTDEINKTKKDRLFIKVNKLL